jgi:hypothetical protein
VSAFIENWEIAQRYACVNTVGIILPSSHIDPFKMLFESRTFPFSNRRDQNGQSKARELPRPSPESYEALGCRRGLLHDICGDRAPNRIGSAHFPRLARRREKHPGWRCCTKGDTAQDLVAAWADLQAKIIEEAWDICLPFSK